MRRVTRAVDAIAQDRNPAPRRDSAGTADRCAHLKAGRAKPEGTSEDARGGYALPNGGSEDIKSDSEDARGDSEEPRGNDADSKGRCENLKGGYEEPRAACTAPSGPVPLFLFTTPWHSTAS